MAPVTSGERASVRLVSLTPPLFEDHTERSLVRLALDLAPLCAAALHPAERALMEQAQALPPSSEQLVETTRQAVTGGDDPLGRLLSALRPPEERRLLGAFYTPPALVASMVEWALAQEPARVVDAGCGSGRFAVAVARRCPALPIVAVDIDPVATLLTRAALHVIGAEAATVLLADYPTLRLPPVAGRTAFVGNPPYVRHHDLAEPAKRWVVEQGRQLGYRVSGRSGLHAYFFVAALLQAQPGDAGCFVTSAEWLDVGYGAALRDLFLNGLGGSALHLVDTAAATFEDVKTTTVVTCFTIGAAPPTIRARVVQSAAELGRLEAGQAVPRARLAGAERWSKLIRSLHAAPAEAAPGGATLGSLVRVHRGIVTGANDFFVLSRQRARDLGLLPWCRPAITDGREIMTSGGVIRDAPERKLLLAVPRDVDRQQHPALDAYLRLGEASHGGKPAIAERYIPGHRRPWWHVAVRPAPPLVASYMARQAPVFALNPDGLALVNIGHGLYPRQPLPPDELARLCAHLNRIRATFRGEGRTYQGGLEKFEPREMEALPLGELLSLDGTAAS